VAIRAMALAPSGLGEIRGFIRYSAVSGNVKPAADTVSRFIRRTNRRKHNVEHPW
jgi:hypothetical protein